MNSPRVSPNYPQTGVQSPGYSKQWKVSDSFKVTKLRVASKDEVKKKRDLKSNARKDPTKTSDATSYLKSRRDKARNERRSNILNILDENLERTDPASPQRTEQKRHPHHRHQPHDRRRHHDDDPASPKRPISPRSASRTKIDTSPKQNRLRVLNPFNRQHGRNGNSGKTTEEEPKREGLRRSLSRKGILRQSATATAIAVDDNPAPANGKRSKLSDRRATRRRKDQKDAMMKHVADPKDDEMNAILEEVLRKYPKERCKTFADHQEFAFAELTTQSNQKKDVNMTNEKFQDLKTMLKSHLAATLPEDDSIANSADVFEENRHHHHSQRLPVVGESPNRRDSRGGGGGSGEGAAPISPKRPPTKQLTLRCSPTRDEQRSPKRYRPIDIRSPTHRSPKKKIASSASMVKSSLTTSRRGIAVVSPQASPTARNSTLGASALKSSMSLTLPLPRHLEATKKEADEQKAAADPGGEIQGDDATSRTETMGDDDESTLVPVVKLLIVDPAGHVGKYTGTICINTGKPHGSGRLEYEEGGSYQGDWNVGSWSGYGRHVKPNGDIYEGHFFDNAKHGTGTYRYRDGKRIFEGRYVTGQRVDGQMTYGDGSVYKGQWYEGKRHGRGTYRFKDGSLYKGEFLQDVIHGVGQLVWPDGAKYIGEWNQGHRHGMGKEYTDTGRLRYEGRWKESAPVS